MSTTVEDNSEQSRYEIRTDAGPGAPAGFAYYELRPGQIVFTHTEVDPAFEGHGIGSALAARALDDARRRGLVVVPRCPFIRAYITRHPEYADLLRAPTG